MLNVIGGGLPLTAATLSSGAQWPWVVLVSILSIAMVVAVIRYRWIAQGLEKTVQQRTAQLQVQTKRAQEAAVAKSDFLSRMSHEIRTPLNAIIGMSQIGLDAESPEKMQDCMQKIDSSSRHLLGIINDILDFSKIEAGKLELDEELFSLTENMDFITSMFKTRAAEKQLDFRIILRNIEHDGLIADALRLNQVLINLISNAFKFTPDGGSVLVMAEEVLFHEGEAVYRFTVKDTGIGIEPEQAKKLFTPFAQANTGVSVRYGGTGLGLAISKSIVTMMRGEIGLKTHPGEGSIFSFFIRAKAQEKAFAKPRQKSVAMSKPGLDGMRVLVVDDVEINREIVLELLKTTGARVDTAENGQQAVEMFLASAPGQYHMILMDMLMPVLDGCAATREIRASDRDDAQAVKIIAMTANVMREDVRRTQEAGMNGYLAKPLDVGKLYALMEENL